MNFAGGDDHHPFVTRLLTHFEVAQFAVRRCETSIAQTNSQSHGFQKSRLHIDNDQRPCEWLEPKIIGVCSDVRMSCSLFPWNPVATPTADSVILDNALRSHGIENAYTLRPSSRSIVPRYKFGGPNLCLIAAQTVSIDHSTIRPQMWPHLLHRRVRRYMPGMNVE